MVLGNITQGAFQLFAYWTITIYGRSFQISSAKLKVCNSPTGPQPGPVISHNTAYATPAGYARMRFRLFPFRSPLLGESSFLSFPRVTEMFHFTRFTSRPYVFRPGYRRMTGGRLPDSGIPASKPISSSARLIAACHALHRLLAPRHPPYALISLTILILIFQALLYYSFDVIPSNK